MIFCQVKTRQRCSDSRLGVVLSLRIESTKPSESVI
jgi:hypothetical protein